MAGFAPAGQAARMAVRAVAVPAAMMAVRAVAVLAGFAPAHLAAMQFPGRYTAAPGYGRATDLPAPAAMRVVLLAAPIPVPGLYSWNFSWQK